MPHTLGQRIKAAKELGGYESLDSLARAVNLTNLSAKSLRRSANDERTPQDHELEKIAEVCGVAPAFFTVDLTRIAESPSEPATPAADDLQATLRTLTERLDALRADHEILAGEVSLQNGTSAQTTPGQVPRGQQQ